MHLFGKTPASFVIILIFASALFSQSVYFITGNETVSVSGSIAVPVTVKNFTGINGVQFSMQWNPAILQFNSISDQGIPSMNFNTDQAASGILSFVAYNSTPQTLSECAVFFKLNFTALGSSGSSSSITFTDTPTPRRVTIESTYLTFVSDNGSVFISPVQVKARVLLEGPYNTSTHMMKTDLNPGVLPEMSPYSDSLKTCGSALPDSIVDWVYISLRTTSSGADVTSKSALLSHKGYVCDLDGSNGIIMSATPGGYYVIVRHRNHISVMTSSTITLGATSLLINFPASSSYYFGSQAQSLEAGVYGMFAGDADGSDSINASDASTIWGDNNLTGYENTDCDLSGTVDARDRSIRYNNRGISTNVP